MMNERQEEREAGTQEGRQEGKGLQARWISVWVVLGLAILMGAVAVAMVNSANADDSHQSTVSEGEELLFDLAWDRMGTADQTNMCGLRDRLTDEQYRQHVEELEVHIISPDAWVSGVDRRC